MAKGKVKKLASNLGMFAIGNLGSKLISFILIPIFTRYMSAEQFGHVDLITTTVNMLLPIVALSIADAVFRFVMDQGADTKTIFSTSVSFTLCAIMVTIIALPIMLMFHVQYAAYLLVYLALGLLQTLFQNFVRGIGYVRIFAMNGLFSSIVLALIGMIEIVALRQGVVGYLDALIISALLSVFFMFFSARLWRFYSFSTNNIYLLRRMLVYSVPLIPNAFLWFFTNDASRFFVVGFLGLAANGLYAVATKIPTIINVFYNIFAQAWQISAVEEYESEQREEFFSSVFNANVGVSVILIGGIIIFIRPLMAVYAGASYFEAWKIVPMLLIASFFSNLSSFLGTIYLASKRTTGVMKTTIYGMLANVIFNFTLIPLLGLQGAGIGAALGFAFVTFVRLYDTRKMLQIHVNRMQLCGSVGIIIVMTGIQILMPNLPYIMLILVLLQILILVVNVKPIIKMKKI